MQDISHEISRGVIFPFQCSKNKMSNFYQILKIYYNKNIIWQYNRQFFINRVFKMFVEIIRQYILVTRTLTLLFHETID